MNADLSRLGNRTPVVRGRMVVRFRYFVPGGTGIVFQLFSERARDNFRFDVKNPAPGRWETVEAPLSAFYRMSDRASRPQEGDRFTWLNITAWGTDGPVYFDDIELAEVLGP